MKAASVSRFGWLLREKTFILDTLEDKSRHPVLGLCLGAQLIADVLGARVTRNPHREIGWFPVSLQPSGRRTELFRHFPLEFTPFHWHGDTFSLPPGAAHLASSEACVNQAFMVQDRVLGLQFHLEYTRRNLQAMIRNAGHELVDDTFVQGEAELLDSAARIRAAQGLLFGLLDAWVATQDGP